MDATRLLANETGLEEDLGATEALTTDSDDVSIWQFVGFLLIRGLSCCLHLGVVIQCNVRELLLHITYNLALGRGGERVATLCQYLHHILSEVASCKVQAKDGVRQSVTL